MELTSKNTACIDHANFTWRGDLDDSTNVEDDTTDHQRNATSPLLHESIAENGAKEASGLEGGHNVCLESSQLSASLSLKAEASLERWQSQRTTDKGGVVTEHGRAHGGREGEEVDLPVIDCGRSWESRVIVDGERVAHFHGGFSAGADLELDIRVVGIVTLTSAFVAGRDSEVGGVGGSFGRLN